METDLMILSQKLKSMVVRCACLLLAGTALQCFIGNVQPSFLIYPWSLFLAAIYLCLLFLLYVKSESFKFVRQLYGRPAYLVSLVSMLVLTLFFGLIRQDGSSEGLWGWLGFTRMHTSWVFVLFLLHFMTVLGLKAIEDLHHWRKHSLPAVVMHASFFVILAAAVFGSGEKTRFRVTAVQGRPIGMGVTEEGRPQELPFTLLLKEFSLDEYPPRIYRYTSQGLSKDFVAMEALGCQGELDTWQLECLDYLEMAGLLSEDSAFVAMNHVGATTALYVRAISSVTPETAEGWVSSGSFLFAGSTLPLPDGSELVMPYREVKKYLSTVEVIDGDEKHEFDIAVNHPASLGAWKIYQSGYDSERGRWSTMSILECVRDPWYPIIHVAMWMVLVGGVMMFVTGHKKQKEDKE